MNILNPSQFLLEKKAYVVGYLEELCETIELTPAQLERIATSYAAIGEHLIECVKLDGFKPRIFPQGSVRLGTTVRPIHPDQHFDADVICKLEAGSRGHDQARMHALVGDGIREHGVYKNIITVLKRGWRLNYAESARFHIDVTPAVPKDGCALLSVFVPNRELKQWLASNPEGYATWFFKHAQIKPRFVVKLVALNNARGTAGVDPLPNQIALKNMLQRVVQLLKRHRDIMFEKTHARAPISVVLTTLAAKSYAKAALANDYDSEFDLMRDIIAGMPEHIQITSPAPNLHHFNIPNETVYGENFAEKWNKNPDLAVAFYEWHKAALAWIDGLIAIEGRDLLQNEFQAKLGSDDTVATFKRLDQRMASHRADRTLLFAAPVGLNISAGHRVKPNNFFGQ